ncbi:MAG: permease [Coriobacteriaceae bacterium]|nr:permease [Coriobacteriaceae bacterium]
MTGTDWALLGGAMAAILGGIGSSIGITAAAGTVSGIVSEDSEKFGKLLPITAMPGTQGFYGFIAGILVLILFGVLGGKMDLPLAAGFKVFIACQPVGWVCMVSGIYQGITGASAAGIVAKRSEDAGKALIFPALVETYAVLSLIITVLMMISLQSAYMK